MLFHERSRVFKFVTVARHWQNVVHLHLLGLVSFIHCLFHSKIDMMSSHVLMLKDEWIAKFIQLGAVWQGKIKLKYFSCFLSLISCKEILSLNLLAIKIRALKFIALLPAFHSMLTSRKTACLNAKIFLSIYFCSIFFSRNFEDKKEKPQDEKCYQSAFETSFSFIKCNLKISNFSVSILGEIRQNTILRHW